MTSMLNTPAATAASAAVAAGTDYRVLPIAPEVIARLRESDDAGRTVPPQLDEEGGSPLRCCLRHSRPGERITLLSYAPLHRWAAEAGVDPGAYDERGPVFVHADADDCEGAAPGGRYPGAMHGMRVFRAYDAQGRILRGELVPAAPEGSTPEQAEALADAALRSLFADPTVQLVHVRAVGHGCFVMDVRRK